MAVRININPDTVVSTVMQNFNGRIDILSSEILKDCNKYCKRDTGMLIASSLIHSDLKNGKLIWQTPYAARQYHEIQTAYKDSNPMASWRWCEVAKQAHFGKWERIAQRLMEGAQNVNNE